MFNIIDYFIIKIMNKYNKFLFFLTFLSMMAKAQTENITWLRDAKFGILVHFLNSLQNTKEPWNQGKVTSWEQCVNDFNTETFAQQANEIGARYVIFTVQQGDRNFCIPNITFEKMTGYKRGTATVNRDLIADLYNSLNKRNIKLMLYVTGDGVSRDYDAAVKLKNPMLDAPKNNNQFIVHDAWVNTWSKVLEDISLRYRKKISGWWVDGAYPFIGYNEIRLKILSDALKKGNPNALIAFNQAPQNIVKSYSKWDDYTAGEMYHINTKPEIGGIVNGKQWHILTFLGKDWALPGSRFSKNELSNYISEVNKNGGVVSLDVLVKRDGSLDPMQYSFLKDILKNNNKNND
jgi:hypothetical protein